MADDRTTPPLLSAHRLSVRFTLPSRHRRLLPGRTGSGTPRGATGVVNAVSELSFELRPGHVLALVGESGCGKSVLAAAILGLLPGNAEVRGEVWLDVDDLERTDLLRCPDAELAGQIRARRIGLVPQSAATHLTPVRTARSQLEEVVRALHPARSPDWVADRVATLAAEAGLSPVDLDRYPHELSGGMASRVATALALAGDPDIVIADEPTTGLDPALVDHTLDRLRALADAGHAVLLITHDLAAAERVADVLAVMYAGQFVEVGPAPAVFADPWHDYTRGLLTALPSRGLVPIPGDPPRLTERTAGCAFHQRCPGLGPCSGDPVPRPVGDRMVACV